MDAWAYRRTAVLGTASLLLTLTCASAAFADGPASPTPTVTGALTTSVPGDVTNPLDPGAAPLPATPLQARPVVSTSGSAALGLITSQPLEPGAGIDPGVLSISVLTTGSMATLPAMTIAPSGERYETTGRIATFEVTDTRAGDLGYAVTAQVDAFENADASAFINAQNLGWTPFFVSSTRHPDATDAASAGMIGGDAVSPADAVGPDSPGLEGLAQPRLLFRAPPGNSTGTTQFAADLALVAPTYTAPGSYSAHVTVTAS